MMGAFLGWKAVIFIIMVGSFLGAAIGTLALAARGKDMRYPIPFGPFLCLAAIVYLFWGKEVLEWYVNFV
jgi:leader peptidase (prepilin peptidase)/N-methyltransferase